MKITRIEHQQKNKDRVSIYIDNKYSFSLTLDQLLDYSDIIKVGNEITQDELNDLKLNSEKSLAFGYILYQISYGPKSEHQMREKFKKNKKDEYSNEAIDFAIEKAKRLDLINDNNLAKFLTECYMKRNIGKFKIREKLYIRGIPENIINITLDEYIDKNSELENAIKICSQKNKTIKNVKNIYDRKNKLYTFLARKGYSSDIIKETLEIVLNDTLN